MLSHFLREFDGRARTDGSKESERHGDSMCGGERIVATSEIQWRN